MSDGDRYDAIINGLRAEVARLGRQVAASSTAGPRPEFFAYQTGTGQTVPTSGTTITLDAVVQDTEGGRVALGPDDVVGSDRYLCRSAGVYEATGCVVFANLGNGSRACWLWKNGNAVPASEGRLPIPSTASVIVIPLPMVVLSLAVGDYVQLRAISTAATSTATSSTQASSLRLKKTRNG